MTLQLADVFADLYHPVGRKASPFPELDVVEIDAKEREALECDLKKLLASCE